MRYFHCTDASLNIGDILLPAVAIGHQSKHAHLDTYHDSMVYLFTEDADPISYSYHGTNLYEVQPLDEVLEDPEWRSLIEYYQDDENFCDEETGELIEESLPGYYSKMTTSAKVIARL